VPLNLCYGEQGASEASNKVSKVSIPLMAKVVAVGENIIVNKFGKCLST
jgi:hypothetical protein